MISLLVLGIETSCDETGAALVRDGRVIADRTTTQLLHEEYGGVVPELASRAHERLLMKAVEGVLGDAGIAPSELNAVAATYGPGLAGALLVGVSFAKGLAQGLGIPFIGVNHLEAHLWAAEIAYGELPLPFLGMIVSGGHTITVSVKSFADYRLLGTTHDDAAGELFDKVGRMLGLGFPAGAAIDKDALDFEGKPVNFPRARVKSDDLGFSFSGLKTAVLYFLREHYEEQGGGFDIPVPERKAISAGIISAVADMLINGLETAWSTGNYRALVISGGVASSRFIRNRLRQFAVDKGIQLRIPPPEYCTDNGTMVAYTGYLRYKSGFTSPFDLNIEPSLNITDSNKKYIDQQQIQKQSTL